ncbi:hypothetical protein [Desulfosarcina cetonica]|uniref:hypothetical protein n=1 Tax=Desulfosarcina cetonica TaxID=90730 RepID=UPI001FEE5C9A|nr:hypothetical protein [Desulfosarcina cetonica]
MAARTPKDADQRGQADHEQRPQNGITEAAAHLEGRGRQGVEDLEAEAFAAAVDQHDQNGEKRDTGSDCGGNGDGAQDDGFERPRFHGLPLEMGQGNGF